MITVDGGRMATRGIRFKGQLGSWKGLRFTYGKNMAGCIRTVLEQDVYTALYGFGAGLPVTDDRRTWFWAHCYADGEGVLTATSTHDATRELVASGRICAIGKYVGLGFTPWDGVTGPTHRQHLTSASFAADMATFSYLNFNYLFYSCTSLASVNGLGNLSGVRSMRYMFSSCTFTTIDFRGFDSSTLTDLFYMFSGCSKLTTIFADAIWALPSSGITGSQCFYSCSTSLVGGNGTTWASNKTAYTCFRIDTASTPGCITVV